MPDAADPFLPRITIRQALGLARKLYSAGRSKPVARDGAALAMGYAGLTSRAVRVLHDLETFALLASLPDARVQLTPDAIEGLFGLTNEKRGRALLRTAFAPPVLQDLARRFEGCAAEPAALRERLGELDLTAAQAEPVVSSYLETCHFLGELLGSQVYADLARSSGAGDFGSNEPDSEARVVLQRELAPGHDVQLLLRGPMDEAVIAALEEFVAQQRASRPAAATRPAFRQARART